MAHVRQPKPDSGLGFQVKVLEIFEVVRSSLGNSVFITLVCVAGRIYAPY